MPCRHDQMLTVICRILASLSHCWFVCVFWNRLKSAELKSRRVIKRPLLADRHRWSRHCMVTKSSLQSWEIHPKPLLSLHGKGQLAGCSLGYRLYFCVSKPSSGRRLHEAETGSRLTNGSCAMSLNSNHVVLNTVRKNTQTNNVKDLPRSGRPRETSDRDDRALQCLVRRIPFATSPVLKQHWLPNKNS
jgi:hypothetical protein